MKNAKGFSPLVAIIALMVILGTGIGISFHFYKATKSPQPPAKEEPGDNSKIRPAEEAAHSPPQKNPEPTPTPKPAQSKLNCVVGGCSGELCVSADAPPVFSICVYKEEYSCYKTVSCELQANGECGWTKTAELNVCIERARNVDVAPALQPLGATPR